MRVTRAALVTERPLALNACACLHDAIGDLAGVRHDASDVNTINRIGSSRHKALNTSREVFFLTKSIDAIHQNLLVGFR